MEESKHDRFLRIAENRTNKIITLIRLLGNCSNKSNYEYTEEDINKIFKTIIDEVNVTKNVFARNNKRNNKFSLK